MPAKPAFATINEQHNARTAIEALANQRNGRAHRKTARAEKRSCRTRLKERRSHKYHLSGELGVARNRMVMPMVQSHGRERYRALVHTRLQSLQGLALVLINLPLIHKISHIAKHFRLKSIAPRLERRLKAIGRWLQQQPDDVDSNDEKSSTKEKRSRKRTTFFLTAESK